MPIDEFAWHSVGDGLCGRRDRPPGQVVSGTVDAVASNASPAELHLKAFTISKGQSNTVTKSIKQVIFSVAVFVSYTKALDLIKKVIA